MIQFFTPFIFRWLLISDTNLALFGYMYRTLLFALHNWKIYLNFKKLTSNCHSCSSAHPVAGHSNTVHTIWPFFLTFCFVFCSKKSGWIKFHGNLNAAYIIQLLDQTTKKTRNKMENNGQSNNLLELDVRKLDAAHSKCPLALFFICNRCDLVRLDVINYRRYFM